jgi:hypothetical protein
MMAQKLHVESPSELAHTIETLALPAHASSSLLSLPPTAKTARVKAASDAERVQSWTCLLKAGFDNNCEHLCMRRTQALKLTAIENRQIRTYIACPTSQIRNFCTIYARVRLPKTLTVARRISWLACAT